MNLFCEKSFVSSKTNQELKLLSYTPNLSGPMPLLIYLHGAGSRGSSLSSMANVGPIGELNRGRKIMAKIVAPQCSRDTWFELFETLIDFAEQAEGRKMLTLQEFTLPGLAWGPMPPGSWP